MYPKSITGRASGSLSGGLEREWRGTAAALARALGLDRAAPECALGVRHEGQRDALATLRLGFLAHRALVNTVHGGKMRQAGKRLRSPLISTSALAAALGDPGWRVADCRFELGKPEAGRASFLAGHIPGAVHVDLERDLSAPITPATGRHPLPSTAAFAATLARLGIGNEAKVACYDAGSGAFAARLWWMLRWVGHDEVAVLDGGFAAWVAEGRPVETDTAPPQSARFVAHPRPQRVIQDAPGLMEALARGETLVDVRGAERFEGKVEPLDAVAGHVPGAVNLPYLENIGANGRFRPAGELAQLWRERAGAEAGRAPICMCGSGVTACQGLLALEAAGVTGGRLYAGSWSEWIRDPARPVARGA
jgi:thiosulfate/3-mercaptopyruvate sulfurtransferase